MSLTPVVVVTGHQLCVCTLRTPGFFIDLSSVIQFHDCKSFATRFLNFCLTLHSFPQFHFHNFCQVTADTAMQIVCQSGCWTPHSRSHAQTFWAQIPEVLTLPWEFPICSALHGLVQSQFHTVSQTVAHVPSFSTNQ